MEVTMNRSVSGTLVRGAIAGAAASVPQAAIGKAEEILFLPPGEDANIAPRLLDRLAGMFGDNPSRQEEWMMGTVFHVLYGAGWGAAYAVATERLRLPPLIGGSLLGGLIYGITFPRWGGAVLTRTERPPGLRSRRMTVVAWSVAMGYGIATGLIYESITRSTRKARGAAPREGADESAEEAEFPWGAVSA